MKIILNILGGVVILTLSFWITLVAIDNWPASTPSDFEIAVQTDGLTDSTAITGSVDLVRLDSDGRLALAGWAFDRELGLPVSVKVLIGAKFEPVAVTKGPREDVTQALRLSSEQARDVAFMGRTERAVNCDPTHALAVVAINQKRHFSLLGAARIPGCGES